MTSNLQLISVELYAWYTWYTFNMCLLWFVFFHYILKLRLSDGFPSNPGKLGWTEILPFQVIVRTFRIFQEEKTKKIPQGGGSCSHNYCFTQNHIFWWGGGGGVVPNFVLLPKSYFCVTSMLIILKCNHGRSKICVSAVLLFENKNG